MISDKSKLAFARFISIIFHPAILILLLPFLLIYRQTGSGFYAIKWQVFSSLFVFLAGFLIYIGERVGVFSDADVTKRKERGKFYAIIGSIVVLYIFIVIVFKGILFVPVIIALGVLFGVLLFSLINHVFKISVHSGVACAFAITIGILYGVNTFFAVIWILPVVLWSRITLKKHTLVEALSGAFLGGFITVVTYFVGKSLL